MSGRLFVTGGQVVRPDGACRATLVVEDGRILDADYRGEVPAGAQVLDARDRYVLPGLVEIHAHGGGGCDFMDATREAFETVVCTHMRHGATTILPTTVACEAEEMRELFELYRRMRQGRLGNALGGVHLEGPFISQAMRGAQNPAHIRAPQTAEVDALMDEAGDLIRLITAAPELEGMQYLAKRAGERGIALSSGHSDATFEQIARGYEWGFRHITHMYSNTPTVRKINQRVRAGILEFAWLTDDVRVELIGDGRHVPCEVLRLALKIKGADKINLTSDAMRAAGTDAKESYLGAIRPENRVIVEDGVAKLPDRSFYAGSIATADRMLAWAVNECGVPLHEAVRMLSLSPAKVVGLDGQKGSLDNGKDADFLLADEQLRAEQVFLRGERMF